MGKNKQKSKIKNHKQRVIARNHVKIEKEKSTSGKAFLIAFFSIVMLLLVFNLFCVRRTKMHSVISIVGIRQVSKAINNNYISYGKTGSHSYTIKFSAIYEVRAITEDDELIEFDTKEPEQFWHDVKIEIKYIVVKVFNKTTIRNVEILRKIDP